MRVLRIVLAASASLAFLMPARASDWYVDAANGNDANNGQSAASAWKTLTHAVNRLPASPGEQLLIHAAPGVYDPANGESYPLLMKPGLRIVGDAGSASTFLETAGTRPLLEFDSLQATTAYTFDALSGASGITLRNSATGIACSSDANLVAPSFSDLAILDMSTSGVTLSAVQTVHPTFDHVNITTSAVGVQVNGGGVMGGAFGNALVDLTDCVIHDCTSDAVHVFGAHGTGQATFVRCRITGNGGAGVFSHAVLDGTTRLIARQTLIATNASAGVYGDGSFSGFTIFTISDSTIAHNGGPGVKTADGPQFSSQTYLDNCILFGNVQDVAVTSLNLAVYSDSGGGELLGHQGCISADPMFVNTVAGDFRLRYGSPCADTGDPSSSGSLDLLGHTRTYDGDLDTHGAPDMGAFEFETLHQFGTTSVGQQFGLEIWGASGSSSQLFVSKQPLTPAQSTPFGDFFLAPGSVIALGTVPAAPGPPHFFRRRIPNDPSFIGTTFSFQALTDSAAAPQGQAYTNPTSFVVMP
jgi:hypothetical protein